jgi:hypothetical protein
MFVATASDTTFNSLSRDHSGNGNTRAESGSIGRTSFNSLSRDHFFGKLFPGFAIEADEDAFNSLSRDHITSFFPGSILNFAW